MSTDVKIGLWIQRDKEGNSYMSGKDQHGNKVYCRKNSYKKTEKQPDYILIYQTAEQKAEAVSAPASRPIQETDEDIPF